MKTFLRLGLIGLFALATFTIHPQTESSVKRTEDVIYGRKFGTALTLDVFQPAKPNGCAILFMVSGGFFSSHEVINPKSYAPFLDRGYTVSRSCTVHNRSSRFRR